jgi:hypothetical protein
MNKLIRELAEQATKDKWKLNRYMSDPVFDGRKLDTEKFVELILIEVIATIYGSDIKDKKQDKLVDKLLYKFGMLSETKE